MMHPLHDYIAKQIAERIKSKKVMVWYDARQEFFPFVAEVCSGDVPFGDTREVTIGDVSAQLAVYGGSFFEVRSMVEPFVQADEPEATLIYVPGRGKNRQASVLMELEKSGECYEPQLRRLARNVLRRRYTDGVIDEILSPEHVTYEDLARASSETSATEPPSILKAIFYEASGSDAVLAAWLVSDERDAEIEAKDAGRELTKMVRSRLGLDLPSEGGLAKHRSKVLRYVLATEFRSDLNSPAPTSLDGVPLPKTKDDEGAARDLAKRLRVDFPQSYPVIADRLESEFALAGAAIPPESLGPIDTFRFEERVLLTFVGELIAQERFDEALRTIEEREHSFWLDHDVGRKAQWEASRRMAELGRAATSVRSAVTRVGGRPDVWVDAYTADDGWYRMDREQRRLEAWVANLEDEADERPLGVVRRVYEDACHAMARGFTRALVDASWTVPGSMHQTHVFSDVVVTRPRPVAYFLVDAMRFEMGVELAERLPKTAECSVRHAIGALPSITPIGMAALLPGASGSFSVVEQRGKLGVLIDDSFLPDLPARRKFAAARVPGLVDIALDELLSLQSSKLTRKLEGAQVVVVRSQEIDHAGEAGFTYQARQVMDTVIDNLARAIRRLATAGIEHSVVSADHGHLFFAYDRDESMRADSPGGNQVDLHRRCWIGRGGATPSGCVRVSAEALGYASDLQLVFPPGCGVFRAGGDLAFHHGGPSLQELVLPVLTVRMQVPDSTKPSTGPVAATGLPDAVTNRIFSVTLELGGPHPSLFAGAMSVRPLLMSAGRQVGTVGMTIDAELDRATGCVELQPGKPITVAFLLTNENVASLRVVVQDPVSDAELYRSPSDIPVRLGV